MGWYPCCCPEDAGSSSGSGSGSGSGGGGPTLCPCCCDGVPACVQVDVSYVGGTGADACCDDIVARYVLDYLSTAAERLAFCAPAVYPDSSCAAWGLAIDPAICDYYDRAVFTMCCVFPTGIAVNFYLFNSTLPDACTTLATHLLEWGEQGTCMLTSPVTMPASGAPTLGPCNLAGDTVSSAVAQPCGGTVTCDCCGDTELPGSVAAEVSGLVTGGCWGSTSFSLPSLNFHFAEWVYNGSNTVSEGCKWVHDYGGIGAALILSCSGGTVFLKFILFTAISPSITYIDTWEGTTDASCTLDGVALSWTSTTNPTAGCAADSAASVVTIHV